MCILVNYNIGIDEGIGRMEGKRVCLNYNLEEVLGEIPRIECVD